MDSNDTPQPPQWMGWRSFSTWYDGVLYTLVAAVIVCVFWALGTLSEGFTPQHPSMSLAFQAVFALCALFALHSLVVFGLVLLLRPHLLGERRLAPIRRKVQHLRTMAAGLMWAGGVLTVYAAGFALDPPRLGYAGSFGLYDAMMAFVPPHSPLGGLLWGALLWLLIGPAVVLLIWARRR